MKIIIGLGNPGEKYNDTRHNVGFAMLDKIQREFGLADFEFNKKFNAEVSKGNIDGAEVSLVKPQEFMNLSGLAARRILEFYKLTTDDFLVIHDDLDIELGKYKIAINSSSAGHNGVQSIINQLKTQELKRIRIGIGKVTTDEPSCRLGAHDFVLGKFSAEEKGKLENISADIIEEIKKLLQ